MYHLYHIPIAYHPYHTAISYHLYHIAIMYRLYHIDILYYLYPIATLYHLFHIINRLNEVSSILSAQHLSKDYLGDDSCTFDEKELLFQCQNRKIQICKSDHGERVYRLHRRGSVWRRRLTDRETILSSYYLCRKILIHAIAKRLTSLLSQKRSGAEYLFETNL